jgi:hypothetical protein
MQSLTAATTAMVANVSKNERRSLASSMAVFSGAMPKKVGKFLTGG